MEEPPVFETPVGVLEREVLKALFEAKGDPLVVIKLSKLMSETTVEDLLKATERAKKANLSIIYEA